MNTSNYKELYSCEKGTLYKNEEKYAWKYKDGEVDYWNYAESINAIKIDDITLMEDLDTKEWDEVDCREIEGTGSTMYIGKHNKEFIVLINKERKRINLINVLQYMAKLGCEYKNEGESLILEIGPLGVDANKYPIDKMASDITSLPWVPGHANWQGKPINEKQELKLKMMRCFGKDPYKDYIAFKIKDTEIAFYLKEMNVYNYGCRHTAHWCDDKHKFYTVEEGK